LQNRKRSSRKGKIFSLGRAKDREFRVSAAVERNPHAHRHIGMGAFPLSGFLSRGPQAAKRDSTAEHPSQGRIHEAGPYSGEHLVAKTGEAMREYEIDLWMGSSEEALRFGRRAVLVEVLRYGEP
jgi:hypothetical protein